VNERVLTVTELTCFIVAKSDGGESDQSVVDALFERPFFQMTKQEGWDKGEEAKKDGEADEHTDYMLAKRPRASVFVVTEMARLEEAQIERSTQPPSQSTECHDQ